MQITHSHALSRESRGIQFDFFFRQLQALCFRMTTQRLFIKIVLEYILKNVNKKWILSILSCEQRRVLLQKHTGLLIICLRSFFSSILHFIAWT